MSTSLAHLAQDGRAHDLVDHLTSVARLAHGFAASYDPGGHAQLAGLWHDLGKYSAAFQKMIREENGYEAHIEVEGHQPRDHSTAGAILAIRKLEGRGIPIALAIAGHHAGLGDLSTVKEERLVLTERLDAALRGSEVGKPGAELLDAAVPELPHAFRNQTRDPAIARRLEMWTRMVFSALCDADFLDTEAFYDRGRSELRGNRPSISDVKDRVDRHVAELEAKSSPTDVNRVRREIREACVSAAHSEPGCFSLNVPTGGGKTLAGLQFGLHHAQQHGLHRVVVAIPYTSIIEQTADVYRTALGTDAVLEHHSALDPRRETPRSRIATENWDAPVIVTTTVQLFESLFANRPGACRKLHRLARSVIVLDEAQTLPPALLEPILDGLSTLLRDFGASLVVSTATQPVLGRSNWLPVGLQNVREIVPAQVRAFERLRRVRVHWPANMDEKTGFATLAAQLAKERDVLCIVHLRKDARDLCRELDKVLGDQSAVHLSALMCAQHRSAVLARIKKSSGHTRVISTQLVEAGVDLDFAVVYRAFAGLEALAQAAGRCNREGKLPGLGDLRVFVAETEPPRGVLRMARDVAKVMLASGEELDLFHPSTFGRYFTRLYQNANLDAKGIQDQRAKLAFKTVALTFRLIEDGWSAPVVVPYEGADVAVRNLEREGPTRETLRGLQRFTVAVKRELVDRWRQEGALRRVADVADVLDGSFAAAYDSRFGLVPEEVGVVVPEDFILG